MDSQGASNPFQSSVMTLTNETRNQVVYFAYGSNLSTAQMRHRCPYATAIGLGYLVGWRWIINERGFANIVQLPGGDTAPAMPASVQPSGEAVDEDGVYGLLYLLPQQDEARLDEYEGVPWAYQKFQTDLQWVRGDDGRERNETLRVLMYVDEERVVPDAPRDEYVVRMERGIQDAVENWGMSEEYANRTMRRFWGY
ncbi:hypothetical protein HJFPF1_03539 [Paramyrothecium foliicola]|nr:hypothetical protein HJFPF1_03539 [Paramyrothecium foliicola]